MTDSLAAILNKARAEDAQLATDGIICTASGIKFSITDPTPAMIHIPDIAHSLSQTCRYAGHCIEHYSVAQHSVLVATLVHENHPEAALWGLLHDAAEAYLGDPTRPCKLALQVQHAYEEATNKINSAIFAALDIPTPTSYVRELVAEADYLALKIEQRDLLPDTDWWTKLSLPEHKPITPLPAPQAAHAWLTALEWNRK